jgi:hypothetical protein
LEAYRELPVVPLSRRFSILPQTGYAVFRHCGLRIADHGFGTGSGAPLSDNPQSAIRNPQSGEVLVFHCGAVGPAHCAGHAHADSLSFIFYAGGVVRIADPGVYEYPAGPWRSYFRSTGAHNTIRLDGCDSTLFSGSFRVGERAEATVQFWEVTPGREQVLASHNGYRRLPGRPVHWRRVRRVGREWCLDDEITGRGRHLVELRFHLPGAVVAADSEGARAEYADGWRLRLRVDACRASEVAVEHGWHSPDWKTKEPCPVLVYRWHTRLPIRIETRFEMGRPVRVPHGDGSGAEEGVQAFRRSGNYAVPGSRPVYSDQEVGATSPERLNT